MMRRIPLKGLGLVIALLGVIAAGSLINFWPGGADARGTSMRVSGPPTIAPATAAAIPTTPICPGSPECSKWGPSTIAMNVSSYSGAWDETRGGLPLSYWRNRFKGDEGDLVDPFLGSQHFHLSLKEWANADPSATYIVVTFKRTATP